MRLENESMGKSFKKYIMIKKFIIKNINEDLFYYGVDSCGWMDEERFAEAFDTKEDAESVIKNQSNGRYKIEEIYIVES